MYNRLREFTVACQENMPQVPTLMTKEAVAFIRRMVNDELDELDLANTIVDQQDALIDAVIYLYDCMHRHGVNPEPLIDIVHKANMTKVVNGKVIRRDDGKILKPANFIPPEAELAIEIERQIKGI